jgi:hypothetical protein
MRQPLSNRYPNRHRERLAAIHRANREANAVAIGCLWLIVILAIAIMTAPLPV